MTRDERPQPVDPDPDPDSHLEPHEALVHGLLSAAHESEARREQRHARLAAALDGAAPAGPPLSLRPEEGPSTCAAPAPSAGARRLGRRTLLGSAAAASLAAAATLFAVATGGSPALALVRETIARARETGVRRYALEVDLHGTDGTGALVGTIDVGGPARVLADLTAFGHLHTILGKSGTTTWLAHPGEGYLVLPEQKGWMRWLRLRDSAVLIESVDAMLLELEEAYRLETLPDEPWSGRGKSAEHESLSCARLAAHRRDDDDTRPAVVQLWIGRADSTLRRMELTWPDLPSDTAELEREVHALHDHGSSQRPAIEVMDHAPRFGARSHLAPARIRFDLMGYPELAEDWFQPQAHAEGPLRRR